MLVKTDAIILKSIKYRDTSKIVTAYTKDYGKIHCIAKGARSFKNKFGASLEPLSYSQIILYKKEHRDLHLLSQGSVLVHFKKMTTSLSHLSIAFAAAELLHRSTLHEEKNIPLFELFLKTLQEINKTEEPEKYLYAFQIQWARIMGVAPLLESCVHCGTDLQNALYGILRVENGTVLCDRCSTFQGTERGDEPSHTIAVRLSQEAMTKLRFLATCDLGALDTFQIEQTIGNEIETALRSYVQHHSGSPKPLQSKQIFYRV